MVILLQAFLSRLQQRRGKSSLLFSIFKSLPLVMSGIALFCQPLFSQEVTLTPLANTPLHGNYCVVSGGVSLREAPHTDTFDLFVPGTPVRSYWVWTGRSLSIPNVGDDRISVAHNSQPNVEIVADDQADSPFSVRTWHSYIYTDTALSLVQPFTNTYTISDLSINALNAENHGAGLLVVYESPACPYQKIEIRWGLDSFHHSRTAPHGPDSENTCTTFNANSNPRDLGLTMMVGGVAGSDRGNLLWTLAGSGFIPPTITPDAGEQPYPNALPIVTTQNGNITQTLIESPGPEWDIFNTSIEIQPSDTFACAQLESPADQDGISGIWALTVLELPIEPPSIQLEKGPNRQSIVSGSPVTFTLRVENTGPTILNDVTITDALVPNCNNTFPTLAPNAVESYECSAASITDTFTNTAIVSALPPASRAITATDSAAVIALSPAVQISKSPDLQTIISGEQVTFTIQITNSGDVPLTNVSISDPLVPNCSQDFGTVAAGATRTVQCLRDNVASSFENTAIVTAISPLGALLQAQDSATVEVINPNILIQKLPAEQIIVRGEPVTFTIQIENSGDVLLTDVTTVDPLVSSCSMPIGSLSPSETFTYQCTTTDTLIDFTNVITATGTTPLGGSVADTSSAMVNVLGPQIEVTKSPSQQTIRVGATAQFTITVNNVGDVTLNTVVVTDTVVPECNATFERLRPGESESYSCIVADVQQDFTNVVQVSGLSPSSERVSDEDSASVSAVTAILDVQKLPDFQTILLGESATFTISVQNVGDAAFDDVYVSNIIITDTQTPECNATIGRLEPGERFAYTCVHPGVNRDFTNIAEAGGQPSVGDPVSDQDWANVRVVNPAISITKSPDLQTIATDSPATFSIRVENSGSVTLTQVVVSDPLVASCSTLIGTLGPGQSQNYSCTLDNVTEDFVNEATVTGQPPFGNAVTDSDSAAVDVVNTAVSISKLPELQSVVLGSNAIFTITVENLGDVTLFDATVIDPLSPDCNRTVGDLSPGSRQTYTCIQSDVRSDFINLAEVTARPAIGPLVDDSAQATVDLLTPSIDLTKEAHTANIQLGQTANFTITVQNSGDTSLEAVTVTDQKAPDCNREIGTLSPGSSQSYSCAMPNIAESTVNVAVVQAQPPIGPTISNSAEASITVPSADLRVSKDDRGVVTQPGGLVLYFISYTNEGAGAATDTIITEIVPQFGQFIPEESSPDWVCENNDFSEGAICQYIVGNLAANTASSDDIVFAIQITNRLPESVDSVTNIVTIDGRNNSPTGSSNLDEESTPVIGTALGQSEEPTAPERQQSNSNRIFIPFIDGVTP